MKKFQVRMWCTVPSPFTSLSTKKSDGSEEFATTGSVGGCSVLPKIQFAGIYIYIYLG